MAESRSVLILMDYQRGIVDGAERAGAAALASAARALSAARDHGVPVVHVRVAFRPDYPEIPPTNRAFAMLREGGDSMTEVSPLTAIVPEVAPLPGEPVVVKRRFGAFSGSDLDVVLRGLQADHLVLAGISTSGVVLSTVRYAGDLDYGLTVLADACADHDPEVHRVLVRKVFPRQAEVLAVDEWIESLG
ncbi:MULTISPECIES: cysteine hydrolase family protein [Tsukamurella]|uniref:cysteine hydrolase family protein n=1 Tax=Tsukamurella TaxID=2060 RepID=UPI002167B486|nr:isochorismatase family cysteine hydrolase [Tsukamurella ocularis]MCS3780109.1 nicotinamidase-related amidase [Tsukamurella ocularis]MCS3786337.1 nicotinamidase-related amidase [Tsukamurella ocularis]MCS3849701.1 nicotinamidase-related amidase [Tsukamurella ocularis]